MVTVADKHNHMQDVHQYSPNSANPDSLFTLHKIAQRIIHLRELVFEKNVEISIKHYWKHLSLFVYIFR